MTFKFEKYQATGNDFIMVDNREGFFPKQDQAYIAQLCHRQFGIGADGLILIEEAEEADFSMVYFNADGAPGSFCGNGSRAATRFAESLGLVTENGSLLAFDGLHFAQIDSNVIRMSMANVQNGSPVLAGTFIDTGSPHYVEFKDGIASIDVFTEGRNIRSHEQFSPGGCNVNFVERKAPNKIAVRTFERGVENETLSCGTGVTASAMIAAEKNGSHSIKVETPGGELSIDFVKTENGYENVFLTGPAIRVYGGEISG